MRAKQLTLLFLTRQDKVLLAMKKRGFGAGRWNGVGGEVEENETPNDAAIRECREEINVTPTRFHQVATITFNEVHDDKRKIMNVSVYICTAWEGIPSETEEMRPEWFKKTDIPYKECWSDDKYWLPLILDNKIIKATFIMDNNDEVASYTLLEVK